MTPELHDDNGVKIYFNGWFKWAVSGVIVAMWGLLVLMTNGFAKDVLKGQEDNSKKIEKNSDAIVDVKIAFGKIDEKLKNHTQILEEIKRAIQSDNR